MHFFSHNIIHRSHSLGLCDYVYKINKLFTLEEFSEFSLTGICVIANRIRNCQNNRNMADQICAVIENPHAKFE